VDDDATMSATGVVVVAATDVAGAGGASVAVTGAAVMAVDDSGVDVTITADGASDDPQALITIATAALTRNRRPPTPPASHLTRPNNDITPGHSAGISPCTHTAEPRGMRSSDQIQSIAAVDTRTQPCEAG